MKTNKKSLLKDLIPIFAVMTVIGVPSMYLISTDIQKQETKKNIEYILDTNIDGKLSSDEIKRFYDEIGINPYDPEIFRNIPTEFLDKFMNKYKK